MVFIRKNLTFAYSIPPFRQPGCFFSRVAKDELWQLRGVQRNSIAAPELITRQGPVIKCSNFYQHLISH